jgi:hypothetical protein
MAGVFTEVGPAVNTADYIVIATVFGILVACLVVDWWVRNRD